MNLEKDSENAENKFILFYLGEELYAAPILSVREVIEYKEPKPIPESQGLVDGVINIRGEVIAVIDLRKKFGVKGSSSRCQLIFENETSLLAATVDSVESVSVINKIEDVSQKSIKSLADSSLLMGVGQLEDRLVNVIDLQKIS